MFRSLFRALRKRPTTPTGARRKSAARPKAVPLAIEGLEKRELLFSPYTHVAAALEARTDLIDDGRITVAGRSYEVPQAVVEAIRNYPTHYNGGVIGPDGFPDLIMGQGIVHPTDTGKWLRHVYEAGWRAQGDPNLTAAAKGQILAWSYGYLTHAAGDVWSHTLVNELAHGVFPALEQVPEAQREAAIALRHIIIEGYIRDATSGVDGNPNRTRLSDGDVSDDSTPGTALDAPHAFIYENLVRRGVGPDTESRGKLLDKFHNLRNYLAARLDDPAPRPLEEALRRYSDTKRVWEEVRSDCSFSGFWDSAHDLVFCPIALGRVGVQAAVDTAEAALTAVTRTLEALLRPVRNAYFKAWIDDIDEGLRHWSELGLAVSRGLFDPQARRDLQNFEARHLGDDATSAARANHENAVSLLDTVFHQAERFINDHLLGMLGAPDIVGDALTVLRDLITVVDDVVGPLGLPLNPLRVLRDEIKEFAKGEIKEMINERLGLDIDLIQGFLQAPSASMEVTSVYLGSRLGNVPLFRSCTTEPAACERRQLDRYLGLGDNPLTGPGGRLGDSVAFARAGFAAYDNTVTMSKLIFLDGAGMDRMLSDRVGTTYSLYGPAQGNIMLTVFPGAGMDETQWLRSIDGDHAWRADGHAEGHDGDAHASLASSGSGNFPLWESCLLREQVLRGPAPLFRDWENGTQNFPDRDWRGLEDPCSADRMGRPPAAVLRNGTLTVTGTPWDDRITVTAEPVSGPEAFRVRVAWAATPTYAAGSVTFAGLSVQRTIVHGEAGNDFLSSVSGAFQPAELYGGAGNDTLEGGNGPDILFGGRAILGSNGQWRPVGYDNDNDVLSGGPGNDTYPFPEGGLGSDRITENPNQGRDTLDFSRFGTPVTLRLATTSAQTVAPGQLTLTLGSAVGVENVLGSAFHDSLTGNDLSNALSGGFGADTLVGGVGDDSLFGEQGDDVLEGEGGSDLLDGGAGNDTYRFVSFTGAGSDRVTEVPDADRDTLTFAFFGALRLNLGSTAAQAVTPNLTLTLSAATGLENVSSTSYENQVITGNARDNLLASGSGNDILEGAAGHDTLEGGFGNDTLRGGAGNDTYRFAGLFLGHDTVEEPADLDRDTLDFAGFPAAAVVDLSRVTAQPVSPLHLTLTLSAATGLENVVGSPNADQITGNGRNNVLAGGGGNDTLAGAGGHDTLEGSGGDDVLRGGAGNDTYRFAGTLLGRDTVDEAADADQDTFDFSSFAGAVTVYLGSTLTQTVRPGDLSLTLTSSLGVEHVVGSAGNDTVGGNPRANTFQGGAGHDQFDGGGGDDWFEGGAGNDTVYHSSGADSVQGGAGDDTYVFLGTNVRDTIAIGYDAAAQVVAATINGGPSVRVSLPGFEVVAVYASGGDDQVIVALPSTSGLRAVVEGGDGNDSISAYASAVPVLLNGGAGDDRLWGGQNNDELNGGSGNDALYGGAGQDRLRGEDGNDYLDGGADLQRDTLDGGLGLDRFVVNDWLLSMADALDVIQDFTGYDTAVFGQRRPGP